MDSRKSLRQKLNKGIHRKPAVYLEILKKEFRGVNECNTCNHIKLEPY